MVGYPAEDQHFHGADLWQCKSPAYPLYTPSVSGDHSAFFAICGSATYNLGFLDFKSAGHCPIVTNAGSEI